MVRLLGRPASTVSREVRRNGSYDRYRAAHADAQAWVSAACSIICDDHDGKMRADPEPGRGTKIVIELPFSS